MTGMARRSALGLFGVAAAAGVGIPFGGGLLRASDSTGAQLSSRLPLPPRFARPLPVPRVLAPSSSDATTDYYDIAQREARVEIVPGAQTTIWGYEGTFPGPTLVSRSGRRTVVRHRNELPVPVVVHLHGGHTPAEHDGYPTDLLLPRGMAVPPPAMPGMDMPGVTNPDRLAVIKQVTREYVYPLEQRAATLWYHDHRMGFTGLTVWRGLAGFHLVHDDEESALRLPSGDRDLPLMITDRAFEADGSFRYPALDPTGLHTPGVTGDFGAGVLGDVILVNGAPWPVAEVAPATYRLRLLNASNARRYRLALDPQPSGGGALVQVGTEGGLLAAPVTHDSVDIAPAQRYDVLVDFGRYAPGQEVTLTNQFGTGGTADVMRFRVGSGPRDSMPVPARLSDVEALDPARAAVTRDFNLRNWKQNGRPMWRVNGEGYAPDRASAMPRLGDLEVWRLVSDFHHPVHLHLAHFQVLSRDGQDPGPFDGGWKDTVDLLPNQVATIAVRFTDYRGRFVFHCHNLEHEDMEMMANFVVG
jgi:spore coat protein A, manganese oxidase